MDHHICTAEDAALICRDLAHAARQDGSPRAANQLGIAAMLCTRWDATLHYTGDPHDPSAVVVAKPKEQGTRKWGRYLNRILCYAPPRMRSVRLMSALDRQVCAHYLDQGLSRVRTLSLTADDYALHRGYRWTAWAIDSQGRIVHDAALDPTQEPSGVPPHAASLGATRPLHHHEIQAALTAPQGPYLQAG